MAQWGNTDVNSNSTIWGVTMFNKSATATNRNNFYENVTPEYYSNGGVPMKLTAGQFGVDATEMQVYNGSINMVTITNGGSGYGSNAAFVSAASGGGGTGANVTFSGAGGRITGYTIVAGGSSYETAPTITILPPQHIIFNGNTAVSGGSITLSSANSFFLPGDVVTYASNVSSTPVGLTNGTNYTVVFSNTTVIQLGTLGSPVGSSYAIAIGSAPYASAQAGGASIQGTAATAAAVTGGALHRGVTHAGWVVRRVGEGGRAGRVQYETLVAMGTITGDGSDDTVLPDSNT